MLFTMIKINTIEDKVNKISNILSIEDTSYKSTYNKILPKIKDFNRNASFKTVQNIAKVMHYYNLDNTNITTKMCMGQILQESGANQFQKEGKLVVSSGGAIGIAQITPKTALGYMKNIITDKDIKDMLHLGCTNFSFVKTTYDVKTWLKNEKNNIVLWGYIMHDLFKHNKDIEKTLVCYNAGIGGMQTYLDSGNVISNHEYIKNIKNKLASINAL